MTFPFQPFQPFQPALPLPLEVDQDGGVNGNIIKLGQFPVIFDPWDSTWLNPTTDFRWNPGYLRKVDGSGRLYVAS